MPAGKFVEAFPGDDVRNAKQVTNARAPINGLFSLASKLRPCFNRHCGINFTPPVAKQEAWRASPLDHL
jgi:hypothetical protein